MTDKVMWNGRGGDGEGRVLSVLREAEFDLSAKAVAERMNCDPDTARKYLKRLEDKGVVNRCRVVGHVPMYEINNE